jgi:hypothetical protein
MKWGEILAAGTIAVFVWKYFSTNGTSLPGIPVTSGVYRPIDDPIVQAKIAAIQAAGPYKDYSNIVEKMESGQWYGGL